MALAALAAFTFRRIRHEGRRRLLILALAGGLLLTIGAGTYAYIAAQHRESSLRAQAKDDLSAISSAESQQEVDRRKRKLQQAFSDLDDALGRFSRGAPPPLDIRPSEDYSDSPSVISARSRLDATTRELAAVDAPWPAARIVLLIGTGILTLVLMAYWPVQWSRAGFDMEAGRSPSRAREPFAHDSIEIEAGNGVEGGDDLGSRSFGWLKIGVSIGLVIAAATIGYFLVRDRSPAPSPALPQNVVPQPAATLPTATPTTVVPDTPMPTSARAEFGCIGAYSSVSFSEESGDGSGLFVRIGKSGQITWKYYEGGISRGDVKINKRSADNISATVSYVDYPNAPASSVVLECRGKQLYVSSADIGNLSLRRLTAKQAAELDL
ncbi:MULTISPECIES: hypothetical protein [unclassified Sphingobium]|uniref:hypothetical protein n=1 Tax=unclassified Sphingobium TaxID=2611147 RepID=UPI001199BFCF|nr:MULTISPECIES: hypothetical protein [unclassified Sphingobium]MBG6118539.1 hypothetical protein [Sphingobium sp. JAI105]TWC98758.1 hypothetical protein FB595_1268 [Sphingobium sp. AEW010]TWD18348.1 hypothetical protein FB596_1278 [Sphingobium sp. AEW013]TWD21008.1 hypothetical protein FB594_12730 [Sphingobium sp. AEW001]